MGINVELPEFESELKNKRNCNLVSWKNIHSLPQKFIRHRKNSENLIVHLFFFIDSLVCDETLER